MQSDGARETPEDRGWRGFIKAAREFMYGLTGLEFEKHGVEMRSSLETLFMSVTVGDLLGLPIIPPYYSLRLLPFIVPQIETWKRRVSREREFSDSHEFDLHGL